MKGGNMEFALTTDKNSGWGTKEEDCPHSEIGAEPNVPVPYFQVADNRFQDSLNIRLGDVGKDAHFVMSTTPVENGNQPLLTEIYGGPYTIQPVNSFSLSAQAVQGKKKSQWVSQTFYKIPKNRSIKVLSAVNPMYTAGGPDALIDSI